LETNGPGFLEFALFDGLANSFKLNNFRTLLAVKTVQGLED